MTAHDVEGAWRSAMVPAARLPSAQPAVLTGLGADASDPVQRLESLLDPGTLRLPNGCDGQVATATGQVAGSPVTAFACNPRNSAGALSVDAADIIADTVLLGLRQAWPVLGIWHSGGAQLREGPASLDGIGRIFAALVAASGRVPLISTVLGPAAGGAAYGPALTDFVIMGPNGRLFVTGPDVVWAVTGERVDTVNLGGPALHTRTSGVSHFAAASDGEALHVTRQLTSLFGAGLRSQPLSLPDVPALRHVLPLSPRRAYDVHPVIDLLLDTPSNAVELHRQWARNVVTTLGRLGGRTIGVLANNPLRRGGCLDAAGSDKAARFVRICDALGVPLVVLVDVPGYLPGQAQECDAVVRRGAKLVHAFADATVPRITVILRKAYGGAYIAMNSKALGATATFAWPGAEIGVMSPLAAVGILHRRQLSHLAGQDRDRRLQQLAHEYKEVSGGLQKALELGLVDGLVAPEHTRRVLAETLATVPPTRGGNRNIPL